MWLPTIEGPLQIDDEPGNYLPDGYRKPCGECGSDQTLYAYVPIGEKVDEEDIWAWFCLDCSGLTPPFQEIHPVKGV